MTSKQIDNSEKYKKKLQEIIQENRSARKINQISVYQMPECLGGGWACACNCIMSDPFKTEEDAKEWGYKQLAFN